MKEVYYKKRYPNGKPISKSKRFKKYEIPVEVIKNNKKYKYYEFDDILVKVPFIPSQMKNYELINYYQSLDVEKVESLIHFGITQNECIKRGLIDGKIQSLNGFNTNITSEDYTMIKHDEVGILDIKTQPLPNIDKEYFGLPKTDIILPEDFDYSYSKDNKEVDKFAQGHFNFDTNIGA